jgi:predicted extracellular nuclease
MIRSITSRVALGAALCIGANTGAHATGVVISQIYGGGGNTNAPLHNDFIELFNAGNSAQNLAGWSVQYASSAGGSWNNATALPSISLQPGHYLLIQEAAGSGGGDPLPTADVTGIVNMSGTAGKVALVNSTTSLSGACPTSDASVVDFIGYGAAASCAEGTHTADLSNTTAALRNTNGCSDSNDNSADFSIGAPAPRNSASAANPCGGSGGITLSIADVSIVEGDSGSSDAVFTVTLSEALTTAVTFHLATADGTATAGSDYVARENDASIAAGDTTYSFNVHINGDTTPEPDETFSVDISNIVGDGVTRPSASATGTILNDDPVHIYDIQGDGAHSPFLNSTVTTSGEVTAIGGGGFYIQDAQGDGNPNTSDAVYVYTGDNNPKGLAVGSTVTVSGKLDEFFGMTEFTGSPTITFKPGKPTIQPFTLNADVPSDDPTQPYCHGSLTPADGVALGNFRCLQSMLVRVVDGTVSAPNFNSFSAPLSEFYAYTAGHARPFRGPGLIYGTQIANPPAGYAPQIWNGTPQVFGVDTGKLMSPLAMNAGMHFDATGIMGFDFGIGLLWPSSFAITNPGPAYPITVPAKRPATNLTIGSQNMLRFFNDVADSGSIDTCANTNPGSSDVCPTAAQFAVRLSKAARQIHDVLRSPMVLAVEEMENLPALTSVAGAYGSYAASTPDNPLHSYTPHLIEGNDIGGIDIGFLVRDDITVNAVTQLGKNTQTIDGCGAVTPCPLNDRPPLLLDANFGSLRFAVLAIHNRSLTGVDDPVDGPRIRLKRLEQAQYVAAIVQSWQTGGSFPLPDGDIVPNPDPSVPLIVAGDYNGFEFSDGYVDIYGQIKGTAVQSENLVWAAPITNPPMRDDFVGLGSTFTQPYSFVFDGYAQELDHALVTEAARSRVVSVWQVHGNADLPEGGAEATDPATPLRSADHDGFVIELKGNPSSGFSRKK